MSVHCNKKKFRFLAFFFFLQVSRLLAHMFTFFKMIVCLIICYVALFPLNFKVVSSGLFFRLAIYLRLQKLGGV